VTAIAYANDDEEEKTNALTQLYKAIKEEYFLLKLFKKTGPNIMLLRNMLESSDTSLEGGLKYIQNFFALGGEQLHDRPVPLSSITRGFAGKIKSKLF
jgi:hypothetical protein